MLKHLQQLATQTFAQPPYTCQPASELNPLPPTASPEEVDRVIQNAVHTVRSRNFVSTFQCLPKDVLCGVTPIHSSNKRLFTNVSWKALIDRREALRYESARAMQCSVDTISDTHEHIVKYMQDGAITLNLHLGYLVQHLGGAAAVSHNFSSGILWLKDPAATALLFSSGRIVMTGCCSEEDCQLAAAKYVEILSTYLPSLPWRKIDLKVGKCVCVYN